MLHSVKSLLFVSIFNMQTKIFFEANLVYALEWYSGGSAIGVLNGNE